MKKVISPLVIALATFVLFSCKKSDNGPSITTETPAKTAIEGHVTLDSFRTGGVSSFEFGNKFYASRDGKITRLGCKMASTGNFRVSLWEHATTNLIAATTISVTDTTKFVYNSISPVSVTANTRYVLSINNTSGGVAKLYYLYHKKSGMGILSNLYPFTSGSITYENTQYALSTTSVYPATVDVLTNYFGGVPDIQFEY